MTRLPYFLRFTFFSLLLLAADFTKFAPAASLRPQASSPDSGLRPQDLKRLLRDETQLNKKLELEYALAKEPNLYVVFLMREKRIEFRIRGLAVKSLPIENELIVGTLPQNYTLLTLRAKETENPPQRVKVNPQETTESTLNPQSAAKPQSSPAATQPGFSSPQYNEPAMLELSNMPTRYNLHFDEGFSFMIRPADIPIEEKGWKGRVAKWGAWWSDLAAKMELRMGKEQNPQLRLMLSEEACRSLFWSLADGSKALFVP